MKLDQVGIVPPWLGDDIPHIMEDAYLPVLPVPPAPPGWDLMHYDHGDPGTEPGDCVIEDHLARGA